jgi:flagellar FliJ protein
MAFEFPLETLLRLRHSYERKERLRLAEIARKIAGLRHRIAQIEAELRAAARQQASELMNGLTASEIHFAIACEQPREAQHRQFSNELVELEKEHRRQQDAYSEARRNRQILENLRERQAAEYKRGQDRRQQQAVDDLFLMRRGISDVATNVQEE